MEDENEYLPWISDDDIEPEELPIEEEHNEADFIEVGTTITYPISYPKRIRLVHNNFSIGKS